MDFESITQAAREAMDILLQAAKPKSGQLMVLGCSTSETVGSRIGSNSSADAAQAILKGVLPAVKEAGLILAVQGCEHINRSLCLERADAEKLGLVEVWVRPHAHAGGACVTAYYDSARSAKRTWSWPSPGPGTWAGPEPNTSSKPGNDRRTQERGCLLLRQPL